MIVIRCDGGCGETTREVKEFITIGYVSSHHYCHDCAESVSEFKGKIDDLHTRMAAEFMKEQDSLRTEWAKRHPEGQLPDLIEALARILEEV